METTVLIFIANVGWRMKWYRPFEVMLILKLHQDFINRHNKRGEFFRPSAFIVLSSIYVSNPTIWALPLLSSTFVIFPSFVSWLLYISYSCYCVLDIHVLLCFQEHLCHFLWRILRKWSHEISGSQSCFEGCQLHFVVDFVYLQGFPSEALHKWPQGLLLSLPNGE